MTFLSYAYRFVSNFVFLALVYLSLNFLEKYPQRVMVAVLVLVYAGMHSASALRSFYFFQRIERLEGEARRLASVAWRRAKLLIRAQADRQRGRHAAPCRRDQGVYRPAVPRPRHPAVHRQDRDQLSAGQRSSHTSNQPVRLLMSREHMPPRRNSKTGNRFFVL
jgi:hypothetical protein